MSGLFLRAGLKTPLCRLCYEQGRHFRKFRTQTSLLRETEGKVFQSAMKDATKGYSGRMTKPTYVKVLAGLGVGTFIYGIVKVSNDSSVRAKEIKADLHPEGPIYRKEDVAKHKTKESGIWE